MPHVDIKFAPTVVSGDQLVDLLDASAEAVGEAFGENPDFVSAEIVAQSPWTRNRKVLDFEVHSSPDANGSRAAVAGPLAKSLADLGAARLKELGVEGPVSGWVLVAETGEYALS